MMRRLRNRWVLILLAAALPGLASVPQAQAVDHAPTGISGTVTDLEGRPLPGIQVTVKDYVTHPLFPSVEEFGWASTDANGAYQTGELPSDRRYWVCFADPSGQRASECYGGGPVAYHPSYSPEVAADASGIDAALDPAGSISGRMTSADGSPVSGRVTIWFQNPRTGSQQVASASTDDAGRYTFDRLPAGTYFLHFLDPTFPYNYEFGSGEYWHNVPAPEGPRATPVMLGLGQREACIDEVVGPQVENVTRPTITGTAQVGQTLTVSGDKWIPEGATVTYRWVVGSDTDPSDDPTGPTYVPTAADLGQPIRVRATGSDPSLPAGSVCSAPTASVAPQPVAPPMAAPPASAPTRSVNNVIRPRIKGTPKVGRTLRVTRGAWQPTKVVLTYRWYAGGKSIAGATHRRLILTGKQVGKRVKVRVKAKAADHRRTIAWTRATTRVR